MRTNQYLINKFENKHTRSMKLINNIMDGTFEEDTYEHLANFLLNLNNIYGNLVFSFKDACHNDFNLTEYNYRNDSASCAKMLISLSVNFDCRSLTIKEYRTPDIFRHPILILENIVSVKKYYPENKDEFFYHTSISRFIEVIKEYQYNYYNKMPDII